MNQDFQLFQLINHIAGRLPLLDKAAVYYAKYGPILFGIILIWIWFSKQEPENRRLVIRAATAATVALAINQIIGALYFRPRPFANHIVTLLLDRSPDPSFPSDHATFAFAIAFIIWRHNRKYGYGMLVMAIILGLSRVYVGTHYPLDILGGAVTGLIGALSVEWQKERLEPLVKFVFALLKLEKHTITNDIS